MDNFQTCMASVLQAEGGFVQNPRDPGGATNLGVTLATYSGWLGRKASVDEIKALTPEKVSPLYRALYWMPISGDAMPPALALCVFHAAVNSGIGTASRQLQTILATATDGHIGPATLKAAQAFAAAHGLAKLVRQYQNTRRAFYRSLSTFTTFGKGWLARAERVETEALRLIPFNGAKA